MAATAVSPVTNVLAAGYDMPEDIDTPSKALHDIRKSAGMHTYRCTHT